MEEKIINIIHEQNIQLIQKNEKNQFYSYFNSILKQSHLFIRFGYKILIFILSFFYLVLSLILSQKQFKKVFSLILIFLQKIRFLKDVLKFIRIHSIIYNYD